MGALEDAEIQLAELETYDAYSNAAKASYQQGSQDHFDQVRYMMAMSNHASEEKSLDDLIFIGGLGVLGNLVGTLGEKVINKWRGTRDLDLIIRNRSRSHIVKNTFDELDVEGKSLSIPNKLTFRGYSNDSEGVRLGAAVADVYFPPGKPSHGVKIENVFINDEEWDTKIITSFYGLRVPFISILPLLDMKLGVTTSNPLPRSQDKEDIAHLLALAEQREYLPEKVLRHYSPLKKDMLKRVVCDIYSTDSPLRKNLLIQNSDKYRRALSR